MIEFTNKKTNNIRQKKFPFATFGLIRNIRGFTLVETLVAIGILSISILATFTVVQNSLQNSVIAKDRITAFYLAQEGVEFIKNIRDQNALNFLNGASTNWLTGLVVTSSGASGPCDFGKTCIIDSPLKKIGTQPGNLSCTGGFGSCPVLRQDPTAGSGTGLWGYTGSYPSTVFKREIQFANVSVPSVPVVEVLVTIRISWTRRGVTNSFQITESLFNRQ